MSTIELVLRMLAAFLLVVGVGIVCHRGATLLLGRAPFLVRLTATIVLGMWLASAGFHLLARLHVYTLPATLLSVAVLAAPALRSTAALRRDLRLVRRLIRRLFRRPLAVAFAICSIPVATRAILVPPLGWDALAYHSFKAGSWVQAAGLTYLSGPSAWALYRNILAGGEVFASWPMLVFHAPLLVGMVDLACWLGIAVAGWALARELGLREPWGTAAAALLLAVPPLRLQICAGYVELPLTCVFGGATVLAVRYLRRGEPGALLLALAGYGVAAAVKTNVLPLVALALVFLGGRALLVAPRHGRAALAGALCFAAVVVPWIVDNIRDTGLPLSPVPVQIGPFRLGELNTTFRWYMDRIDIFPYDWGREWDAFTKLFPASLAELQEGLGVVLLVVFVVFFASASLLIARFRAAGALLVLLVIAVIVTVYQREFSLVRQLFARNSARFWVPALAIVIPASMVWCPRWPALGRAYRAYLLTIAFLLLIHFTEWGWADYDKDGAFKLVMWGLVVAGVAYVAGLLRLGRAARIGLVLATVFAGACEIGAFAYRFRWAAVATTTVLGDIPRYWVEGAQLLDQPHHPYRIAFTAGPSQMPNQWWGFYFLGSRFQNTLEYVPVSADGALVDYTPDDALRRRASRRAWLARLDEKRIDAVVALPPPYLELEWLEAAPSHFKRALGDGKTWGVYVRK